MKKHKKRIRSGIFIIAALLIGCIYSDSFEYGQEKYVLLYNKDAIAQDTGWSSEQMQRFRIPVWSTLSLSDRDQVGAVDAGSTVRVLKRSEYGYYVVTPDTGDMGWLNKIYVKSELTIEKAESLPPADVIKEDDYLARSPNSSVKFVERSHEQEPGRPAPIN